MRRYYILFIVMLLMGSGTAWADGSQTEHALLKLEESLTRKGDYQQEKENRIKRLRHQLGGVQNDHALYQLYIQLYDEYKSYKYDSAHVYAQKSLQCAERLAKADYVVEAKCAMTFCLLSSGLYKEAFDEIASIDIAEASPAYKQKYFKMYSRLCYDMADYNHSLAYQDDYIREGSAYTDSLKRYLKPQSDEWLYAEAMKQMKEYHYDESMRLFEQLLRQPHLDKHTKAIVTSCLGWIDIFQNRREESVRYLAEAAICDNETATKETTALWVLGGILYEGGDIERAMRFVQLSLDDANYYDARQRKIEIGALLPIIEQDRYNMMKNQRNAFIVAVIAAVLLVLFLLAGMFIIRRQMKKLQEARQTIEERNCVLQDTNNQLQEANEIKNEFIGKSFYSNVEYINKVEKLYRMVDRKIAARQYDDLRSQLKESTLNAERRNMCAGFDETFLKLFPDFVEKYNQLFEPKDRKVPDDEKSLTNEMRIFALIRLGVDDSERIANFLDYSVHTINTYKTRVKNKSVVDNDLFEQHIMEIGKSGLRVDMKA